MAVNRFGPDFSRIFAASFLQELSFAMLVHFPGYLSDLGATEGVIGILYSASAVVSLVFRPWLGRILDITHRRTVLLVTGIVNIVVVLGLITTSSFGPYLWILFLAQRTFQVALFTTMITYGADSVPIKRRTQGLAIYGLSGLIPISFAGYLGDVVIEAAGFSRLFLVAAVSSIVSWLIVWTLPILPVRSRQPRRSYWQAFVQRNLMPLWFASFLFFLGIEGLFTFLRTYVDDRQVGSVGLFFAVYGASAAITRIVGGSRYDALPHRASLVTSVAVFGSGLVLLAVAQTASVMMLSAFVTGTAHGTAFPLISSEVINRARVSERGSAVSIFTSIFDMALLFGAPLIGFMIDGISYLVAFSVAGAVIIGGSFVYGLWDRRLSVDSTLVAEEVLE